MLTLAIGVVAALAVLTVVLRPSKAGGHGHGASSPAPATAASSSTVSAAPAATTLPSPVDHAPAHHHPAIAASTVSAGERDAAQRLLDTTRDRTARFTDLELARAEGYRPITAPELPLVHFHNGAYHRDGRILDPERPEDLVYFNDGGVMRLVGAMYVMPEAGLAGPQPGGALTTWHAHLDLCFEDRVDGPMIVGRATADRPCPDGSELVPTPEMLHVWLYDNPDGPFATNMDPAILRSQLQ